MTEHAVTEVKCDKETFANMNDKKETESSGKDSGHGRGLLNIPQHSASCNMCAFSFVCTLVNVLVATGKTPLLQSDDDLHMQVRV